MNRRFIPAEAILRLVAKKLNGAGLVDDSQLCAMWDVAEDCEFMGVTLVDVHMDPRELEAELSKW